MIHLDTDFLVRFFVRDVENQFKTAKLLMFDKLVDLYIPVLVIAETNYILQEFY